jgi:hypothetical protein
MWYQSTAVVALAVLVSVGSVVYHLWKSSDDL